MVKIEIGKRVLALENQFVPDNLVAGQCNEWYPERDDYWDFGDCNQVRFDTQIWLSGPGAASTNMDFERATQLENPDQFEVMTGTPYTLTPCAALWFAREFGRGGATPTDKYPRGLGRIHMWNSDVTPGNITHVRLRMFATGLRLVAGGR